MQLHLTDDEAAALINLLTGIIEGDPYQRSPRVETLRQIRAKLPGIRKEPLGAAQSAKRSRSRRRSRLDLHASRHGVRADNRNLVQIAEDMARSASPSEIVSAILHLRPSFAIAELAELLDRAKDLQAEAEEFQGKAAILMEVVEKIANSPRRAGNR